MWTGEGEGWPGCARLRSARSLRWWRGQVGLGPVVADKFQLLKGRWTWPRHMTVQCGQAELLRSRRQHRVVNLGLRWPGVEEHGLLIWPATRVREEGMAASRGCAVWGRELRPLER